MFVPEIIGFPVLPFQKFAYFNGSQVQETTECWVWFERKQHCDGLQKHRVQRLLAMLKQHVQTNRRANKSRTATYK